MRSDLLQRAVRDAFPASALRKAATMRAGARGSSGPGKHRIHSGTTIFTMKYTDGIMCAADRKTSGWGYSIVAQDSIKIRQVDQLSVVLGCGDVSSIQLIEKTLATANREFRESNDYPLSIEGQSAYLSELLRFWHAYYGDAFEAGSILAGLDAEGAHIFELESDGCVLARPYHASNGSGGFRVEDQLDARWVPDLSRKDALIVAMHCLAHSGWRDSGSSDAVIATPTVVVITSNKGVEFLPSNEIERALGAALLTKRWANQRIAKLLATGQPKPRRRK